MPAAVCLYDTADDGCNSSTGNAELGSAEFTENQDVVEAKVHEYRRQTGYHRNARLAAFAERARVNLFDAERNQTDQHDRQIFTAVAQNGIHRLQRTALFVQVKLHQRVAEAEQHGNPEKHDEARDVNLVAERVAYALVVSFAIELRPVDARARQGSEDAQIDDEQQLVHDGNAGHRLGADPSDHQIIEQADEVGDAVLDHDRHRDRQRFFVKFSVSD